jgi:formylglycine-generating enzyme required for sulfatase activity
MLQDGKYDQAWASTDAGKSRLLFRIRRVLVEPGYENHPVTAVSWRGTIAYVQWLSAKTGYTYRLLTESEWEYAARAGTQTSFYFGDDALKLCEYANIPNYTWLKYHPNWGVLRCTDGYAETAPVGRFKPNSFGLYDILGNAWEWVEDCWHKNYDGAPTNGTAWIQGGDCSKRVVRGLAYDFASISPGIAYRGVWDANAQLKSTGFRVARVINS